MPRKRHPRSKNLAEDDASESKTEVCGNPSVYHCCKRCASKRQTRYLPQEMISNIVLHLPAQGFHMRHFRREWNLFNRTQSRIHDRLLNSTGGVVIQELCSPRNGFYVELRRGCLEICKFDCGFEDLVWSSCNGLVLAPDCVDQRILSVINPLTKQRAILPTFPGRIGCYSEFSLAFAEASLEYKVVHTHGHELLGLTPRIAVLTIGVDKDWRHIDIQYLSLTARSALTSSPFVTRGYIHWTGVGFVLTLNVETETIRLFPSPRLLKGHRRFGATGSNLTIFHEHSMFLMDVREMDQETGEWTMLLSNIDLKPVNDRFKNLFTEYPWCRSMSPTGFLGADRQVLLLTSWCVQKLCVAYNMKTREIQSLELDSHARRIHVQAHVNSLLWLERGFRVDRLRKRQGITSSRLSCKVAPDMRLS